MTCTCRSSAKCAECMGLLEDRAGWPTALGGLVREVQELNRRVARLEAKPRWLDEHKDWQ